MEMVIVLGALSGGR